MGGRRTPGAPFIVDSAESEPSREKYWSEQVGRGRGDPLTWLKYENRVPRGWIRFPCLTSPFGLE
jgi:hypothetical protein